MKTVIWYIVDRQQEQRASFDSEEELNMFLEENPNIEITEQYEEDNEIRSDSKMHSYDGESCIFHFDAGLTGDVIIQSKDGRDGIRVSAEDILKLVAFQYILGNKVRELEQMDYKDLLK